QVHRHQPVGAVIALLDQVDVAVVTAEAGHPDAAAGDVAVVHHAPLAGAAAQVQAGVHLVGDEAEDRPDVAGVVQVVGGAVVHRPVQLLAADLAGGEVQPGDLVAAVHADHDLLVVVAQLVQQVHPLAATQRPGVAFHVGQVQEGRVHRVVERAVPGGDGEDQLARVDPGEAGDVRLLVHRHGGGALHVLAPQDHQDGAVLDRHGGGEVAAVRGDPDRAEGLQVDEILERNVGRRGDVRRPGFRRGQARQDQRQQDGDDGQSHCETSPGFSRNVSS